jgi:TrmH family RNA methyltransferase
VFRVYQLSDFNSGFATPLYNRSLLTDTQRDRIEVVLVSPRNPLNIGAVARAMANFGFARMSVVAPYEPHWREARSAIGAPELLKEAKETGSLAEAVRDCTLVVGTGTLTYRKPQQPVLLLTALAPIVQQHLARDGRVALVFGPEKHGLTRDDLSFCHVLVEIPTDQRQPSMNLGQAAAVCLYELAAHTAPPHDVSSLASPTDNPSLPSERDAQSPSPPSGSLDLLATLIHDVMVEADYSPLKMQAANRHSIRLLLRRLRLNSADNKRILGLFRRILWRLRRTSFSSNVTD